MNPVVNLFSFAARNKHLKSLLTLAGILIVTSAFSQQEFRGVILEDDRYDRLTLPYHYGKVYSVARVVDFKPFLPRVVSQTFSIAPVTWSTVWYGHTILEAKRLGINATDPRHKALALSPAFTYRSINSSPACDQPVSMIDALNSFRDKGAPRFANFPEVCANELPAAMFDSAAHHKLGGYVRLFNSYDPKDLKVHEVKKSLNTGSPVVLGMICPPSFRYAGEFWQPREDQILIESGLHSVCIIGYNDLQFGGAFEIVNSWGPRWGSNGTTWIRYDDFAKIARYGFQLIDPGLPMTGSITFYGANNVAMPVVNKGNNLYTFREPYSTGQQIRVSVNTKTGLFFAMVVVDAAKQRAQLFPADTVTNSFVPAQMFLPNETEYYQLTEPAGRSHLYFVFSISEAELKKALQRLMSGEKLPAPNPALLNWDDKTVLFESKQATVAITVELLQR